MRGNHYPLMIELFDGYLHQDYEIYGDTFEEVVDYYKRMNPRSMCLDLVFEIDVFMAEHPDDLNLAFKLNFKPQINHTYRWHTTFSFLEWLKRLLSE